jgi:hypothetical protein
MVDPCGILYTSLATGCVAPRDVLGVRNVPLIEQFTIVRSGDTQDVGVSWGNVYLRRSTSIQLLWVARASPRSRYHYAFCSRRFQNCTRGFQRLSLPLK